jgi:tRNA nucleotidyltransferase/poly(A) polymerase
MSIADSLEKIEDICSDNYIGNPYIVGGIPRDIFLNRKNDFRDIDITTNTPDIIRLAVSFGIDTNSYFKVFADKHVSVYHESGTFDFSSNFVSEEVEKYLNQSSIAHSKELLEVYSRDFTINTLHKKFFEEDLIDPIGSAKKDLDSKIIKTCVPANITFSDDPRRIFRAINFASRLSFSIDGEIIDYVKNNRSEIIHRNREVLKESFISSAISSSISEDPEITIGYLEDMGILSVVPLVGLFKDEIIKRRLVTRYLDNLKEVHPLHAI